LSDFEPDLSFEVFGMVEGGFIEDEEVRGCCYDEVEDVGEDAVDMRLVVVVVVVVWVSSPGHTL
jgi:hypothetical protein